MDAPGPTAVKLPDEAVLFRIDIARIKTSSTLTAEVVTRDGGTYLQTHNLRTRFKGRRCSPKDANLGPCPIHDPGSFCTMSQ